MARSGGGREGGPRRSPVPSRSRPRSSQALGAIWNDARWTIADAQAASRWIVDRLDVGLFPLPVLAAGDPRSDHLIGTHLGGLLLVALQVRPGQIDDPRQRQYLRWLVDDVARLLLRVRPEFRASMAG